MKPFISYNKELYNLNLTDSAHINYELMLDRYKISIKNDWQDDNGIFIYYSISEMQKSRGYSKPKAVKILKELEEKGLIIKVYQKGKPTKIYLVQNEYTEFAQESMKNHKKDKQHKKVAPRKIAKQEVTESNNEVGVDEKVAIAKELEVQTITDYTENQSICDTFKAIIGREPDNSFKKCIAKRAAQMGLTAENMRGIIELAKKARNPEAYILTLTKPTIEENSKHQTTQAQTESEQNTPLDEYEIEWLIDIEKSKEESNKERIQELEQMLAVIEQKKAEQEAQKPLEQWEIEYISEIKAYEAKENVLSLNTSQIIPPEVRC